MANKKKDEVERLEAERASEDAKEANKQSEEKDADQPPTHQGTSEAGVKGVV